MTEDDPYWIKSGWENAEYLFVKVSKSNIPEPDKKVMLKIFFDLNAQTKYFTDFSSVKLFSELLCDRSRQVIDLVSKIEEI